MCENSIKIDGSGNVTCTTNIKYETEKCTFCGSESERTICFKSGQKINLCRNHKEDIEDSLGLVKERIYIPYTPYTPVEPIIPSPVWISNTSCTVPSGTLIVNL